MYDTTNIKLINIHIDFVTDEPLLDILMSLWFFKRASSDVKPVL